MKVYFYLLFFFITFIFSEEFASSHSCTIIEDQASIPILTPDLAQRKTLKIRLDNGLEAYLVSDPYADKSAAALTVKTGSWEDPKEYPGIAHFLEHMLFLGTRKYPHESEYDRFITEHGGTANAFTADDATSYLFAINHHAFSEALDRFASFFREPLFNPSGVDRELQAIDQEYAKNIEDDYFRQQYVHKELSNPDHPFHAFNIGNKESLAIVSQETLQNWYRAHYSANQMRLVVIANFPLEDLKEQVIAAFKDVQNTEKKPLQVDLEVSSPALHQHIVYISPVKNLQTLTIYWELPQKFSKMKESKPDVVISHLLGHEGKESLLAQLKRENLAEGIRCGSAKLGGQTSFFYLEIDLTQKGVLEVETVIERSFQTIKMLKEKEIPSYIYDELHAMELINYQYQVRENAFSHIMKHAIWIADEELATYPESTLIISKFDPTAIKELLSYLTPHNSFFDVMASSKITGIEPNKQEQWLGAKYTVKPISEEKMTKWMLVTPHPNIEIPSPNLLIPKKLEVIDSPAVQEKTLLPRPVPILDNEFGKIYFSSDNRYLLPKIYWAFRFKTPSIEEGNASSIALADLYVNALNESLNHNTYLAAMAGLHFNLERSENGIDLVIEGFNENASLLFQQVLLTLKSAQLTEVQFKFHKEQLLRQYENLQTESPLTQALEILKSTWHKTFATHKQKICALKKISFDKLNQFAHSFFKKVYIEGVLYGNMNNTQAHEVTELLFTLVESDTVPYPKKEQYQPEIVFLPSNEGPFYLEAKTKSQGNAVILAIADEPYSFKAKAAQQILMRAIKEPFYSALRTKQQTCYLVYSSAEEVEQHLFNCFMVQSNSHDVRDLLARFELLIEGFLQELTKEELTLTRFESIKHSLLTNLEQPPKSLSEMGALLSLLAFKYQGDFDWQSKRIQGLRDLTYSECVDLCHQSMGKENRARLAILLKGNIPNENILEYKKITAPRLKIKRESTKTQT